MLKQHLQQKLLQKLSPQQIQLMKLLQIPTTGIEARIKEELEVNPALQEGKEDNADYESQNQEEQSEDLGDIDLSEYLSDDGGASYKENSGYQGSNDDEDQTIPVENGQTFHEFLLNQLGLLKLNEKEQIIAEQIVGSIGDDGYLRRELRAMVNDLAFSLNVSTNELEIEAVLSKIQQFDPPGVAARDLRECLLIQLQKPLKDDYVAENARLLAYKILDEHFEPFSKKHYEKVLNRMGITREELKEATEVIIKLNPKPSSAHVNESRIKQYIIPDFIIENREGELHLSLNSRNAPNLRVNKDFMQIMKTFKSNHKNSKKEKEAVFFIKRKLDSAKWFIEAIKQRQQTLLGTMNTILEYQREFFLTGDEMTLRPMILKDIAEVTGLDISTVSRVANSKYVQTEFGTFSLKYFFSESLQMQDGEEASTTEVKHVLQEIIDNENKRKPLSDQKLMEMLKEKGYEIARRTVAKYREQLNISVARLRKEI